MDSNTEIAGVTNDSFEHHVSMVMLEDGIEFQVPRGSIVGEIGRRVVLPESCVDHVFSIPRGIDKNSLERVVVHSAFAARVRHMFALAKNRVRAA